MGSAILVLLGLWFVLDAMRSGRTGVARFHWGLSHSRHTSPVLFWTTVAFDVSLALFAFFLAAALLR